MRSRKPLQYGVELAKAFQVQCLFVLEDVRRVQVKLIVTAYGVSSGELEALQSWQRP